MRKVVARRDAKSASRALLRYLSHMEKVRLFGNAVRTRAHHNRREIWLAVALTVFALAVAAGIIAWPEN